MLGTGTDPGRASPGRASVKEALREHEELLTRARAGARLTIVDGAALSFGVGVPGTAPYLERARAAGLAAFARGSGGTGVVHTDGDLLWAIVVPRSDPRVGRDFTRAYERLGRGVVVGLQAVGLDARWTDAPGVSEDCCTLSSRGKVLAADGRIVGGAAQHLTSTALLHHGSISWRVDRGLVDRVFGFPPSGPSSRLGGVGEARSGLDLGAVAASVARALNEELEV